MKKRRNKTKMVAICALFLLLTAPYAKAEDTGDGGLCCGTPFIDEVGGTDTEGIGFETENPNNVTNGANITIGIGGVLHYHTSFTSVNQSFSIQINSTTNSLSSQNVDEILQNIKASLKTGSSSGADIAKEQGVFSLVVPTLQQGSIVEKTVAIGIPVGVYVFDTPFVLGGASLTKEAQDFFGGIHLRDSEIAVVVGPQGKVGVIAAELIKRGAFADQITVAPTINSHFQDVVAVYKIQLPTLVNLLTSTKNTS